MVDGCDSRLDQKVWNLLLTDTVLTRYVDTLRDAITDRLRIRLEIRALPISQERDICHLLDTTDIYVGHTFTSKMAKHSGALKLIQISAAGLDRVALKSIPRNIPVANTYGHGPAIAEYVIMQMLALSRQLLRQDRALRRGTWYGPAFANHGFVGRGLAGRTVGILGLGEIGSNVARHARRCGMQVIGVKSTFDPGLRAVLGLSYLGITEDIPDVMARSDFVVVALPLTTETKGLVGAYALGQLRRESYLINVGRAEVVDEQVLYEALRDERIGGAGIDVWYRYPDVDGYALPSQYPFHELDNVILTPHSAGATEETIQARVKEISENVARCLTGQKLVNAVSTART